MRVGGARVDGAEQPAGRRLDDAGPAGRRCRAGRPGRAAPAGSRTTRPAGGGAARGGPGRRGRRGGGRAEQLQVGLGERQLSRGARTGAAPGRTGCPGRAPSPPPAARRSPPDGARGRCRAGRPGRPGRRAPACPPRPARPACCHSEARVPGQPASTTASRPLTSTPSSSALVAGHAQQLAAAQRGSSAPPLLGQVAGPVGRHPPAPARVTTSASARRADERHHLGAAPGPDERQRTHPVGDEVGEQVAGLGGRRPAHRRSVLAHELAISGGSHRAKSSAPARRAVLGDSTTSTSRPAGAARRWPGRRRSPRRGRRSAWRRTARHTRSQPAQHLGDVGAEDAAVAVALVDDDVAAAAQERAQRACWGSSDAVQHVRVGQHQVRVRADPVALGGGGVAVVRRRARRRSGRGRAATRSWSAASALVGDR